MFLNVFLLEASFHGAFGDCWHDVCMKFSKESTRSHQCCFFKEIVFLDCCFARATSRIGLLTSFVSFRAFLNGLRHGTFRKLHATSNSPGCLFSSSCTKDFVSLSWCKLFSQCLRASRGFVYSKHGGCVVCCDCATNKTCSIPNTPCPDTFVGSLYGFHLSDSVR